MGVFPDIFGVSLLTDAVFTDIHAGIYSIHLQCWDMNKALGLALDVCAYNFTCHISSNKLWESIISRMSDNTD